MSVPIYGGGSVGPLWHLSGRNIIIIIVIIIVVAGMHRVCNHRVSFHIPWGVHVVDRRHGALMHCVRARGACRWWHMCALCACTFWHWWAGAPVCGWRPNLSTLLQ
jgi:hypothetical protein